MDKTGCTPAGFFSEEDQLDIARGLPYNKLKRLSENGETMKKATMKDIAAEAGVSVATVSYVVNGAQNQTIPSDTKERVLEIAKKLNYVPNLAARSLVKQKTGLVGILLNRGADEGVWKRSHQAEFLFELEKLLTKQGYHVLLSSIDVEKPNLEIIAERKLDGVILVDVKEDFFYSISTTVPSGVPLVIVDSIIDDDLFYKVIFDYQDAFQAARKKSPEPAVLIMEAYHNAGITERIMKDSGFHKDDIHITSGDKDLLAFLDKKKDQPAVILNEFLASSISRHRNIEKDTVICTSGCPSILPAGVNCVEFKETKAAAAFNVLSDLMKDNRGLHLEKYTSIQAE
ncbi:LacI family DNA-binding transcriptional regulator [Metabacillus indicus]|uniref:LacI family DNA-binding transcriptional regulator n=1 Tax=Metabacillus indicus TaxID=246786 RepID=UPI002491ACA6|nr:LacI family DNA-binding transcriptional regulator [Metabacillus indicus]